jgi:RNA polymerase sigma-70 factor (ECF subfamily)
MKNSEMTDSELVRGCLEGNMESYRAMIERYKEYAMALAVNILANYQDAEDACQEAFLRAFQNLGKFDPEKSFKNWFYALLSNLCLDQLRKRRRFSLLFRRLRLEDGAADMTAAANPGRSSLLESGYLRRLSPKERMALYLWSQEGYSGAEIAAVIGCSMNTAHVHLFRARAKLKKQLREDKYGRS